MSWYNQYFTPEWEKRFRYQAKKTFSNHPEMIDDAKQSAWLKLFENLKESKKKDITDAYVMAAFKNLLVDEYRHHFGRCRPFAWVKKLGFFWERIAVILCQENIPAYAIAEKVTVESTHKETASHEEQVDFIVRQLKSKEYCSTLGCCEEQAPEDAEYSDAQNTPENELPKNELSFLLQLILGNEAEHPIAENLSIHITEQWRSLQQALDTVLTDDARLMLILMYTEGYTLDKTAQALQKSRSQIRYQLKQVLQSIQDVLKQHDIDLSLLLA